MPSGKTEVVVIDALSQLDLPHRVGRERAAAVGMVLAATATPQLGAAFAVTLLARQSGLMSRPSCGG